MIKVHDPAEFEISLKALIKNAKDEILLLQVHKNSSHPKTYDLPGGRINYQEINEKLHRLIEREIKEETGNIKYKLRKDPVSLGKYFEKKRNYKLFYVLFEAKYKSGKITISDEHVNYRWVKLSKNNYKKLIHPALQELIKNYFLWNKN